MDSYDVLKNVGATMEGNSTEAVSPVVGVMLMLVVTIIIAAVVSASASGVADETEKAPVSVIDAHVDMHYENMGGTSPNIRLNLLSGDSLQTNDLQIITYYTIPTSRGVPEGTRGQVIKHTIDGGLKPGSAPWDEELKPYFTHPQVNDGGIIKLNEMGEHNMEAFGEFIWRPGRVVKVWPDVSAISDFFGFDITDEDYGFGEGSFVEINILHKPSGKIIFKKEIEVKG